MKRRQLLLIGACTLAIAYPIRAQTTWYVDDDQCPGPGSGSQQEPFCRIQDGIDAAASGDAVIVADGIYTAAGNIDLDFAGRLVTLRSENGPEACIIDCQLAGRGFVFHAGESALAVVEGFTVRNGFVVSDNGGGMYIANSSPTISNCRFEHNGAVGGAGQLSGLGGGIYCGAGSPAIQDCTFTQNSVLGGSAILSGAGGGLAVAGGGGPTIRNCSFDRNTAEAGTSHLTGHGGGLYSDLSNPTIEQCTFRENEALGGPFPKTGYGGAITIRGGADVTIRHCTFSGNVAAGGQADITGSGGAIHCSASPAKMANCSFSGNTVIGGDYWLSGKGGALWITGSTPVVANCTFAGNRALGGATCAQGVGAVCASGVGGAVGFSEGNHTGLTLVNCRFAGNTASGEGGGFYNCSVAGASGPTVANCTFSGNASGGEGGGICASGVLGGPAPVPLVTNSIVHGNIGGDIVEAYGAQITVSYSDVAGGWFGAGSNNLDAAPLFAGGPSGSWTDDGVYDAETGWTTFTDEGATWIPDALTGSLLNPDTAQELQLLIAANTATTVAVWGDAADLGAWNVPYQVHDYRILPGSPCIDAADNNAVPPDITDLDDDGMTAEPTPLDHDGQARFVDDPLTPDTGDGSPPIVDMGAHELQAQCSMRADCADLDADGVRDDNCIWWECDAGSCVDTPIVFADMGGQFGVCAPDGVADGNDRFHALNCFADQDPEGGPYSCEDAPPSALNVDAGGPFGDCAPDGVCDINDAFHTLNTFEGTSTCGCPLDGEPMPNVHTEPRVLGRVAIVMEVTTERPRPGELVGVEVFLEGAVPDLRGYQLHLGVSGGQRGGLELVDIAVQARKDHVFAGLPHWRAFNLDTAQMLSGLDGPGITTPRGAYLATFTYLVTENAAGEFLIELLHDDMDPTQRTFLFPTPAGGKIEITGARPAIVGVDTPLRHRGRPRRTTPRRVSCGMCMRP